MNLIILKNTLLYNKYFIYVFIFLISVISRIWATSFGMTSDTKTFYARGLDFQSCWEKILLCTMPDGTPLIPGSYGIISQYEMGGISLLAKAIYGVGDIETFRMVYAVYLSIFDAFFAIFLIKYIGTEIKQKFYKSLLWILSPVTIFISGFHFQIDIVSISLISLSFVLVVNYKKIILGGIFLALALSHKFSGFLLYPLVCINVIMVILAQLNRVKIGYKIIYFNRFCLKRVKPYFLTFLIGISLFCIFLARTVIYALEKKYNWYVKLFNINMDVFDQLIFELFKLEPSSISVLVIISKTIGIPNIYITPIFLFSFIILFGIIRFQNKIDLLGFFFFTLFCLSPRIHEHYLIFVAVGIIILSRSTLLIPAYLLINLVSLDYYARISLQTVGGGEMANIFRFININVASLGHWNIATAQYFCLISLIYFVYNNIQKNISKANYN